MEFNAPKPQGGDPVNLGAGIFHVPVQGSKADKFRIFRAGPSDVIVDAFYLAGTGGGGPGRSG
jgi:hypothetical protein